MLTKPIKTKKWFYLLLPILFVFAALFYREYKLISAEPISSWSQDFNADCAVVLTGGVGRVREGFSLLARKMVKKLVISGVHPEVEFAEIYPGWILMGDINEQDVILERRSTSTFGNAQQSLPIVEALGCQDVLLVTSQIHMDRAYKTFRASFPRHLMIYKYSLIAGKNESGVIETSTEVVKRIFYSMWAY